MASKWKKLLEAKPADDDSGSEAKPAEAKSAADKPCPYKNRLQQPCPTTVSNSRLLSEASRRWKRDTLVVRGGERLGRRGGQQELTFSPNLYTRSLGA